MHGIGRRTFLRTAALGTATLALPWKATAAALPKSDWRMHGFGVEGTRHNLFERELGPEAASRLDLRWSFEAGSGITGTPAVVGDRVVAGSWDGKVHCLDRRSGEPLWDFDAGVRSYPPDRKLGVYASAAVLGRRVIVASDRIAAVDLESGDLLWDTIVGKPGKTLEYFWAAPTVHRGRIYAGVSAGSETETRGRIVCLDARTGEVLWRFFTVPRDVAGGALIAHPTLDPAAGILYAATGNPFHVKPGPLRHSASLVALDASTGELRWADQVHPHDTKNLDLNCPPMLTTVDEGMSRRRLVVVGGKDGIRCWNRETAERLWHVQLTPAISPGEDEALPTDGPEAGPTALADGVVFFASNHHTEENCVLAAIDVLTGDVRWKKTLPAFQFGPMSVARGVVWMGLVDGKLRAWRARDGELLREIDAGQPIAGGPAVARGMVFVGTGAGQFLPGNRLLAFGPKDDTAEDR